jgi:hypothetical protein
MVSSGGVILDRHRSGAAVKAEAFQNPAYFLGVRCAAVVDISP